MAYLKNDLYLIPTSRYKKKQRPMRFANQADLLNYVLDDEYIIEQMQVSDSLEQIITNPDYRMDMGKERIVRKYTDASGNVEPDAVKLRKDYVVDLDIARLFLSILSSTYINGVERTIYNNKKIDKKLTERVNNLYRESCLDEAIPTADMYSQVMNPIIYFQRLNEELVANVQLDYKYFIIEDYYNEKEIEYLIIPHERPEGHSYTVNVSEEDYNFANYTFEIYTKEIRIEVNRAGEIVKEYRSGLDGEDFGENPYDGEIPSYYLRDTINNQGLHRPVDSGLLNLTVEAISLVPEIILSSLVSAYGQWIFTSNAGKVKLSGSLGPFRALHAYNDSETSDIEAKNEKIESNSEDIIRVFDKMISLYSVSKHLEPDLFVMNRSGSQRSGLAVKASQSKLLQQTEARKRLREADEKKIYKKFVKIYNESIQENPIPVNSEMEIKFNESAVFTTELEKVNSIVSAFNNELVDQIGAIAEVNGVSRQQAEAIQEKIIQIRNEKMKMLQNEEVENQKVMDNLFGKSDQGDVQDGDVVNPTKGARQPSHSNNAQNRKP